MCVASHRHPKAANLGETLTFVQSFCKCNLYVMFHTCSMLVFVFNKNASVKYIYISTVIMNLKRLFPANSVCKVGEKTSLDSLGIQVNAE